MDFNKVNSNLMLEAADEVIIVPDVKNLERNPTPEEYLNRLNQLSTPEERLIVLAKSLFNPQSTHEAQWLRQIALGSFVGGAFFGALLRSQGVHAEYIRKHNAAVFDTNFAAQRHFWDTLVAGVVPRGLSYGIRTCLFSTSASFVVLGSMTYRGELYAPDWFVGLGSIGAISRLWLGPRAMAVGGLCGGAASIIGLGVAKLLELATGYSLPQMRLLNHHEYLMEREAKQRRLQLASEQSYRHMVGDTDSFRLDIDG